MSYNAGGSSGNKILIESKQASNSASLTFTTGISGYDVYHLSYYGVTLDTNTINLNMQFSVDGGDTYNTENYNTNNSGGNNGGPYGFTQAAGVNPGIILAFNVDVPNIQSIAGYVNMYNFVSGSLYPQVIGNSCSSQNVFGIITALIGGYLTLTSTVNAIKIIPGSGNILTGTFKLYGIQN